MRISRRTRNGTVSMGPLALIAVALFVGPLYLMWQVLVGAVKLTAAIARAVAAERARRAALPPGNHVAAPNRHH